MSLFNNNLNDILVNKVWNDFQMKIEDDKVVNIINGSKYTHAQNIYNDPKGRLLENHALYKKGKLPIFYYDEVFLRQQEQPYMVDEYGQPLEAQRDMSLFTTLTKQPIDVSGYLVNNEAVKRHVSATTPKQKMIRNDFDFETLGRREIQDFDYKLLRTINLKNK